MTKHFNFPTHTLVHPLSTPWLTYDKAFQLPNSYTGTSSLNSLINIWQSISTSQLIHWYILSQLTFLTVSGHHSGSQLTDVVRKEFHVISVSIEVPEVFHIQPEDHQLNRTVLDTEVHELCTQEMNTYKLNRMLLVSLQSTDEVSSAAICELKWAGL